MRLGLDGREITRSSDLKRERGAGGSRPAGECGLAGSACLFDAGQGVGEPTPTRGTGFVSWLSGTGSGCFLFVL